MPGQLEQRSYPLDQVAVELRAEGDGPRSIAWYPALFDTLSEDLGGFRERIGRRAFTQTLQSADIRSLVNHDPNQILGRTSAGTLRVKTDLRGLHAETAIPATTYANDLLANLENKNITGGSFMFRSLEDRWELEDVEGTETLVRTVRAAELYDVSLVTFPAYRATEGSAELRSLAQEWRQKLTALPAVAAEEPTPEASAGPKSYLRRRLELHGLNFRR